MNYTNEQMKQIVENLQQQGYKNIAFFHPAYNIGGASFIEAQIARYLAENTSLNIYYYDYLGGYGAFLLKDVPNIKVLKYVENDEYFPLNEKCVLFTNSTRCILIKKMHPESKILFWHYETNPCAWNSVLISNETRRYLKLVKKEHAMVYHDWSGLDSLNYYTDMDFNNHEYVNITVDKPHDNVSYHIKSDSINLCFLSRLAPDKIYSLFYLIENINNYTTNKKINLHIIGDGIKRKEVESFCKNYSQRIKFIFTGALSRDDMRKYLTENIDCLFAVGTSVLEGAVLGIPSAILLMSNSPIKENTALWLYNSKEYVVGITVDEKSRFNVQYTDISKMIDDVYAGKAVEIGKKCQEYVKTYHQDLPDLSFRFLKYVEKTKLTYKKLRKCIKYTPYNLYKVSLFKVLNIPFVKKESFANKCIYKLFCFIPILKKKISSNKVKYYVLGLPLFRLISKKPYSFPTARVNDAHVYRKEL